MSTSASKPLAPSPSFFHLIFCAAGIYGFFLTWGVLQERISTMEYVAEGVKSRFKYFQILNTIQALFAALLAFTQILFQRLPFCGSREHSQTPSSRLFFSFFKIAVCSSLASSLGYQSLRHLNYPTMILGKSCKLVPVMLMNFLIYQKRFEMHKYLTVALITTGVSGFMLFESVSSATTSKSSSTAVNSLWGLALLLSNLLMDGATNSWQDQLFIKYRLKSQQLMMFMNLFSSLLLSISLLFYALWQPETSQLLAAIKFFRQFPTALPDVLAFSLCGALGQLFIFHTLEHFGSLSLVTITVTRKLFTILLSLFWFNHQINSKQWACVVLVFLALVLESFIGKFSKKKEKLEDLNTSISDEKFLIIQKTKTKSNDDEIKKENEKDSIKIKSKSKGEKIRKRKI